MSEITRPIILNETGEDLVRAMNHNTATMLAMNTAEYDPDGTLLEVQDARTIGEQTHTSLGEAINNLATQINLAIEALNAAIGDTDISEIGDDVTDAISNVNQSLGTLIKTKTVTGVTSASGALGTSTDVQNMKIIGTRMVSQVGFAFMRGDGYCTVFDNEMNKITNTNVTVEIYYVG